MSKYTAPTTDEGSVVSLRLANEMKDRYGTAVSGLSFADQRDAAVTELIAGTGEVVNVRSYGARVDGSTDDTAAINAALTAGAGGTVFAPSGTYALEGPLTILSDTTLLLAPGAIFKRTANSEYMIGNEVSAQGVYADANDIVLQGGTWDANGTAFTTDMSIVAFAHVDGVTLRDTTFENVRNFHHLEISACRTIRITDCIIRTFTGATQDMVQFDQARNLASFPYYVIVYDNTPCEDIEVRGCSFSAGDRAIVSHFTSGDPNLRIRIIGNEFNNFDTSTTVIITAADDVVISDNTFNDCERGITIIDNVAFQSGSAAIRRGFVVANNTFRTLDNASASHAIRIESDPGTPDQNLLGVIEGNTIYNSARHGIVLIESYGWAINANVVRTIGTSGTGVGIILDGCKYCSVQGNTVTDCQQAGIRLTDTLLCVVQGNSVYENNREGILLDNATNDCLIDGNIVVDNGQTTADTYDGIKLITNCDRNSLRGNVVRGVVQHKYGVDVSESTCNDNIVTDNDMLTGGQTGSFNDAGTSTLTTSANRV